MAMSMPAKAWTLEELHRLPDDGNLTVSGARSEPFDAVKKILSLGNLWCGMPCRLSHW